MTVPMTSCRILMVEDDASIAEGVLMLLELEGFVVDLATSGADALNLIPRFRPDIVLLDIGLPDIDGWELYRRISARWPRMGVIFSTGQGDAGILEQEIPQPHPPHLLKPYEIETLLSTVSTVLEQERHVA